MNKIAIFVEGRTEAIFVRHLIFSFYSHLKVTVQSWELLGGGGRNPREYRASRDGMFQDAPDFFVQIIISGSDQRVISDIRERVDSLKDARFSTIIGLRDARPHIRREDLGRAKAQMGAQVAKLSLPVDLVIAVMEVEAWFLSEDSHFLKIDQCLTHERILRELQIEMPILNCEQIDHPSGYLTNIYWIVNIPYNKNSLLIERIASVLNFEKLARNCSERAPSMVPLLEAIDLFFSSGECQKLEGGGPSFESPSASSN